VFKTVGFFSTLASSITEGYVAVIGVLAKETYNQYHENLEITTKTKAFSFAALLAASSSVASHTSVAGM
jgi:hypothetical protein